MNTKIALSTSFLVGAVMGALVTWKLVKEKYSKIAQEEINSVKEVFSRRLDEDEVVSEMTDEEYKNRVEDVENVEPVISKKKESIIYRKTVGKYSYNLACEKDKEITLPETDYGEEDEPEEDPDMNGKDYGNEYNSKSEEELDGPRVISFDEFAEEKDYYDKLSISYYELDDTLADEQEEIISDTDAIVGDEALLCFGEDSNDPDIVYVRNDRLSIDYEVVRLHKSYRETVLGVVDKPARKKRPLNDN